MTSQAYYDWLDAGRPVSGLTRPMRALRDRLRAYGYTVYDLGDNSHLQASTPQDHTPFSATGWPTASPRWWLHAIDIMPPPGGSGLPSLQALGAQLLADKLAGHDGAAWLKYMNWEPDGNYTGPCYQESFKPGYVRTSSSDRGHIHLSGRTDMQTYAGADGYDPVARVRGIAAEEDGMATYDDIDKLFGRQTREMTDGLVRNLPTITRPSNLAGATETVPNNLAAALAALDARVAALEARLGTGTGGAVTAADVERIVDQELDEAFHGAADAD